MIYVSDVDSSGSFTFAIREESCSLCSSRARRHCRASLIKLVLCVFHNCLRHTVHLSEQLHLLFEKVLFGRLFGSVCV